MYLSQLCIGLYIGCSTQKYKQTRIYDKPDGGKQSDKNNKESQTCCENEQMINDLGLRGSPGGFIFALYRH